MAVPLQKVSFVAVMDQLPLIRVFLSDSAKTVLVQCGSSQAHRGLDELLVPFYPHSMTKKPVKPRPALSEHGQAALQARQTREAEALRENLRRRKAQVEGRDKKPDDQNPA